MVSVVVPLFNKRQYVQRAILSIIRQTVCEFECIVVDDGSTDGSSAAVREIRDARVRIIRQSNRGVSCARNCGIGAARYGLIALLDADDEWTPDFLRANIGLHTRFPSIVASFTNYLRSGTGEVALTRLRRPGVLKSYYKFWYANDGAGISSSSVMVKQAAIRNAGGFPETRNMGEDLDTWFRLAAVGPIAYCAAVHAVYHTGIGITATSRSNWDVWRTYKELAEKGRLSPEARCDAERVAVLLRYLAARDLLLRGEYDAAQKLVVDMGLSKFSGGTLGLAVRVCLRYPDIKAQWIFAARRPIRTCRLRIRDMIFQARTRAGAIENLDNEFDR